MRIIAGEFRHRMLKTLPGNTTRPTLDKVKEAVFSSLGTYFQAEAMLDLFSGSGAIGLEAKSRGFQHVYFNDNNKEAVKIIKENITSLKAQQCYVSQLSYQDCLAQLAKKGVKFQLIYLDPPYHLKVVDEILKLIEGYELLDQHGRVVVESLREDEISSCASIKKYKEANYGISKITYLKKE